jgi:hypothetical protein
MINWTVTGGDRHTSGAGTSYPEALAEALDAVLCFYDAHTADGTTEALPVCTVQIEDHEPIIIRAAARADRDRGRRTLAADLTEALADLTGDLFAQLPSVAAAGTP